jgi:epoxyqueuosine reductase
MQAAAALTSKVKDFAHQAGFELVGVTTPDPPPHLAVYRRWIEAGLHGEMGYLAKGRAVRRREDPNQILPDCKSILVLGKNYLPAVSSEAGDVRVAAYALGDDYHQVLVGRMEEIAERIEAAVGHPVPYRTYTDTGPLLERELAQRAGLGWIGKNTCLINPTAGSYFFLAEMLLGIELVPDSPFDPDRCGTCTRCIDACPTNCIREDRTLDATRCISYLTIELRGEIPEGQRTDIGDWTFGCDVCQQVCPWNHRFALPTDDRAFQPREVVNPPQLEQLISMPEGEFSRHFHKSPVKRTKFSGLLRNSLVVAGNQRRADLAERIAEILAHSEDENIRAHAAWALGQIGGDPAKEALQHSLNIEAATKVRAEVHSALETMAEVGHSL